MIQVNCAKSFTQNQHYNNFRQVGFGVSWIHKSEGEGIQDMSDDMSGMELYNEDGVY